MNFEITYNYSSELSEKISKKFLILRNGRSPIFSFGLLGIIGIVASFLPSYRWVGGFLVAMVMIYIAQSISYVRNAKKLANDLPNKSVVVNFNNESASFQSEGHTSTIEWKRFSQVWITNEAWLFFIYSNDSYTALPANCVSEELAAFILSRINKEKIKNFQIQKK